MIKLSNISKHQEEQLTKYKSLFDSGLLPKEVYLEEVIKVIKWLTIRYNLTSPPIISNFKRF